MEPICIVVPEGTTLTPSPNAAACAGDARTSQRITVVFKTFRACTVGHGWKLGMCRI